MRRVPAARPSSPRAPPAPYSPALRKCPPPQWPRGLRANGCRQACWTHRLEIYGCLCKCAMQHAVHRFNSSPLYQKLCRTIVRKSTRKENQYGEQRSSARACTSRHPGRPGHEAHAVGAGEARHGARNLEPVDVRRHGLVLGVDLRQGSSNGGSQRTTPTTPLMRYCDACRHDSQQMAGSCHLVLKTGSASTNHWVGCVCIV